MSAWVSGTPQQGLISAIKRGDADRVNAILEEDTACLHEADQVSFYCKFDWEGEM